MMDHQPFFSWQSGRSYFPIFLMCLVSCTSPSDNKDSKDSTSTKTVEENSGEENYQGSIEVTRAGTIMLEQLKVDLESSDLELSSEAVSSLVSGVQDEIYRVGTIAIERTSTLSFSSAIESIPYFSLNWTESVLESLRRQRQEMNPLYEASNAVTSKVIQNIEESSLTATIKQEILRVLAYSSVKGQKKVYDDESLSAVLKVDFTYGSFHKVAANICAAMVTVGITKAELKTFAKSYANTLIAETKARNFSSDLKKNVNAILSGLAAGSTKIQYSGQKYADADHPTSIVKEIIFETYNIENQTSLDVTSVADFEILSKELFTGAISAGYENISETVEFVTKTSVVDYDATPEQLEKNLSGISEIYESSDNYTPPENIEALVLQDDLFANLENENLVTSNQAIVYEQTLSNVSKNIFIQASQTENSVEKQNLFSISKLNDVVIDEDQLAVINFAIEGGVKTNLCDKVFISLSFSAPNIVEEFSISGENSSCELVLNTVANASGYLNIVLTVTNLSDTATSTFNLQVNEVNDLPERIANLVLNIDETSSSVINSSNLLYQDIESTAENVTYEIVTVPNRGELKRLNTVLSVGALFTQANINAGEIIYDHKEIDAEDDQFLFTVVDENAGFSNQANAGEPDVFLVSITDNGTVLKNITPSPANWYDADINMAGDRIIACSLDEGVFWTFNSGDTWDSSTTPGTEQRICSLNEDGSLLATVQGFGTTTNIYTSSDYGATWVARSDPARYYYLQISKTSSRIHSTFYSGSGTYRYSDDGGVSWTNGSSVSFPTYGVATNDGNKVILMYDSMTSTKAHISSDFGSSFVLTSPFTGAVRKPVVAPGNDQKMILSSSSTFMVSIDGGGTWVDRTGVVYPISVAYSNDGSKMFLIDGAFKKLFYSSDDGVSINLLDDQHNWIFVKSNADGTRLLLKSESGDLYLLAP